MRVLYGCEILSPTLAWESRFRVFESRVLRTIFCPKRDEVTGEWIRLHNEELYALYFSPNIIRLIKYRRLRWACNITHMGEGKRYIQGFGGKT